MARIVEGPQVNGQVVSKQTGAPLSGVTVTPSSTVYTDQEMTTAVTSVVTNGSGRFSFYAPPGTFTFTLSDPNARPVEPVEVLSHDEGGGVRLRSTFEAHGAASTRLRAVAMGDSTTSGGLRSVDGTVVQVGNTWAAMDGIGIQQAGPQSWFTWACLLSGGRLLNVYNAGIASDSTNGMVARFQTDVVNKNPDVVFLGDAHNDFSNGSGITETTTRANIDTMVKAARAAGIQPILRLVFPDNNGAYAHRLRRHNDWLRKYATDNSLICVDTYSPVVDITSTSGAWVAANTADGTHATTAGAILAAQRVLADLDGLLRGNTTTWGPYAATDRVGLPGRQITLTAATTSSATLTASAAVFTTKDVGRKVTWAGGPTDVYISTWTSATQVQLSQTITSIPNGTVLTLSSAENIYANPLYQDDSNSDGLADSFTATGTITKTLVTDAAVLGQAQSLAVTAGTATGYQQLSVDALNLSVGDRIKWAGLVKILGASGSLNFDLDLSFPGVAAYVVKPLGQTVGVDTGWFYYECDAVIPAAASSVRLGFATYAGTGTILLAQQKLTNMTALAAAYS